MQPTTRLVVAASLMMVRRDSLMMVRADFVMVRAATVMVAHRHRNAAANMTQNHSGFQPLRQAGTKRMSGW
ncbi:MAG: hypothetical protein ABI353_11580 [Isosphaeraceae bacterium]